jgi:molybdopterin/thiamine biosynthesis adenylyltransferase
MPNNTERYARQLVLPQIGKAGQQKLAAARVLLVGLGGLGCPAAQYLAAVGVGTLGLVDHDKVQLSNLHRQILYGDADIGEAKVRAAAPRLRHINPEIHIETFGEKFSMENAIEIAKDFDILLDCTDNFAARDAINAYAVEYRKPNVFASLYRFEGTLTVFDANAQAGCYRCLYGESPEAIQNCAEAGVIGALPGIMGAMQALEAIKIATGAARPLTEHTLVYDGLTQTLRRFRRTRDSACRICGISNG